ncbi:MAG: hypothetical protein ABGZ53_17965 [Fuerstiella sp.]
MKSNKIKVYVVWTPVLREDDRASVADATALIEDDRVSHFWDGGKSLGLSFGTIVTLPRGRKLAWDVYFAFSADAEWGDTPPTPADWMHQLGVDDQTLDGNKLRVAIEALLKTME